MSFQGNSALYRRFSRWIRRTLIAFDELSSSSSISFGKIPMDSKFQNRSSVSSSRSVTTTALRTVVLSSSAGEHVTVGPERERWCYNRALHVGTTTFN